MGATAFGYELAKQFGHPVAPPRPALVPLTWSRADAEAYTDLAGVSFEAEASCGGRSFREGILFTHKGLSGPAILQASSYWESGAPLFLDLLPGHDLSDELAAGRDSRFDLAALLGQYLPRRFAQKWCARGLQAKPLGDCSNADLRAISEGLHAWRIFPAGTEGYEKAEVTAGGVDTSSCSSKTMESAKVPGLYFVGEVLDVTGHLGGYNFQWAWASGFAAGQEA
jgi:predicted Rossmann fold flavoprotein